MKENTNGYGNAFLKVSLISSILCFIFIIFYVVFNIVTFNGTGMSLFIYFVLRFVIDLGSVCFFALGFFFWIASIFALNNKRSMSFVGCSIIYCVLPFYYAISIYSWLNFFMEFRDVYCS